MLDQAEEHFLPWNTCLLALAHSKLLWEVSSPNFTSTTKVYRFLILL